MPVVFLMHGLGGRPITLLPLELYLNACGYMRTHRLTYDVDTQDLRASCEQVDRLMQEETRSKSEPVILIGQSMGGVVASEMHKYGWTNLRMVTIGSPLHGARLLPQLESVLPAWVTAALYKLPYDELKARCEGRAHEETQVKPPPHPYRTISMSWPFTTFDGCVSKDEAMFAEENHTHLPWADHRTVFANPRLWITVADLVDAMAQDTRT